jgi:hypothetical protein
MEQITNCILMEYQYKQRFFLALHPKNTANCILGAMDQSTGIN